MPTVEKPNAQRKPVRQFIYTFTTRNICHIYARLNKAIYNWKMSHNDNGPTLDLGKLSDLLNAISCPTPKDIY